MSTTRLRFGLLLLPALLLAGLVVACHDEQPGAQPGDGTDGGGPGGGPDGSAFVVLIVVPHELRGQLLERQELSANLFSSRGTPLSGVAVHFALGTPNPGGAALSVEEADTDADGVATVELALGSAVAELTVHVSADDVGARAVDVPVHVLDRPTGKLEIAFETSGSARIGPVDVYVMPGTSRCPYSPVTVPHGELARATVATTDQTTSFADAPFPVGEELTIYARGMCGNAEMRTIAAAACLDGVVIPDAGGTHHVTLTMVPKPLNMVGTFDVVGKYDFTSAIPGTAGEVIDDFSRFFNGDVAGALVEAIKALVQTFVGGIAADAVGWVLDLVGPLVADYVNDWFANSAPPWLREIMTYGQDMLQVVDNLEIHSTIRFDKTSDDYRVSGAEDWTGIVLYWHHGCDAGSPPDCGRYEFDMQTLLQADRPIEAVHASFEARTENFNQLQLLRHDVQLQYGRLLLFVLDELILPAVADGAHSIGEALAAAIDCPGLAASVCGDDGVWDACDPVLHQLCISFTVDQATGWCESATSTVGDAATAILERLSFDSVLDLEGDCDLFEDDFDLIVDRMENGNYTGFFRIDGQPQDSTFTATFRGDRRPGVQ